MEQFSLNGKTALVTGSSRGIGKAIATAFAEAGAQVVIHGSSRNRTFDDSIQELKDKGYATLGVTGDLANSDAVKNLYDEASASTGGIDILIVNASIQIRSVWSRVSISQFDQQMHVNVRSSMQLMQLCVPHMVKKGWGRIVTIGSVQQTTPHPEMLVYAASKSALVNMTQNLAKILAPDGVTVNNIAPGVIDTDRNREVLSDPIYHKKVLERIPMGFCGDPADCAGTAVLLCSDAGRYITGQDIFVDGGMGL